VKKPTFYLTFDDGPYTPATDVVLEVLRTRKPKVLATFFLCSSSNTIKKDTQWSIIKDIIAEGHALANHGDDHLPYTPGGYRGQVSGKGSMREEERENFAKDTYGASDVTKHVVKDFEENIVYFENLFKTKSEKFPGFIGSRLPGNGKWRRSIAEAVVKKTGLPHFGWHVEFAPNGILGHVNQNNWEGVSFAAATIADATRLQDQHILLLHDSHWAKRKSVLEALVDKLQKLGNFALLSSVLPPTANATFKQEIVMP